MVNLYFGNGLLNHPPYMRDRVGILLDDENNIIEGPTNWLISLAQLRSRSFETTRNYANILQRFLQWLDDTPVVEGHACIGAHNWQVVDEEILYAYLESISRPSLKCPHGPSFRTLQHYTYRIWRFYNWAAKNGYEHYLELDSSDIDIFIPNQRLLSHINPSKSVEVLNFNVPTGGQAIHEREVQKFVIQSDYEIALEMIEDVVYKVIAAIIRITALRPKDLLQIPYRGTGINKEFIPYDHDALPSNIDETSIFYEFESKGKRRSIDFPGKLWRVICELYIPLRRQRAELYEKRHGVPPRNSELFLTSKGVPVTYSMLSYTFRNLVPTIKASDRGSEYHGNCFSARMLRHTCATYFVYEALAKQNRLGRHFVYDAALDEDLRRLMGHNDVETTLKYYVHLVNRFVTDNLLSELHRSRVDHGLSAILEKHSYFE
ncbi:site-specific integrase [Pseudomonas aeruginosa]|uniref:site-specific integrase n=1 Tax=Pseudomonas aeruginosa TaxID=287 RepID=UPI00163C79B2|nr:site-specific integrase [Pseudomonas aeruginosa]